ncbi:carboxylesterase/lipase family protein [Psychromicrobium lacuslunae]|uniref:Carboxylic ester hydrolase n=1 Tax=Psychromicrobium lacuslunae TaxID=1618207 RepID=A0A0D4BZ30_9MICC|nr:carboxylesterase family protein [Psychromicrobium lacuslunae]AJT41697.1 hypothetical protein UM93_09560 [Psychromicrobium lacuslunae]
MKSEQSGSQVVVNTASGKVRGLIDGQSIRFRGIPFAAAPFGENRYRFPQPVHSWDGIRDAFHSGVGAPQPVADEDPFNSYFNPVQQGEDCLSLDIWTPDVGGVNLPVMVWIHGGGFMTGAGSVPAHDGRTFARDGIVHVGINYRLGIDGFLYLGEGTDNLGLRDQVAALEWVQQNIAAFGGDPANVTVFGQSAGAVSVIDLLAMPAARGLFARAIAQSGSPAVTASIDSAAQVTNKVAERLGVPATRDGLLRVSVERTVAEIWPMTMDWLDFRNWGSQSFTVSPWRAVHGTESLPETPLAAATRSEVPLLAGTTTNETTGFLKSLGLLEKMNWLAGAAILRQLGADRAIRRSYRQQREIHGKLRMVEAVWTDWAFRIPLINLLDARTAASYFYEFCWQDPSLPAGLGANHALEVPFVRDDFASARAVGEAGEQMLQQAPQELADQMHQAWVNFATSGDPGWPRYQVDRRLTMMFGNKSEVLPDPAAAARLAWQGKR